MSIVNLRACVALAALALTTGVAAPARAASTQVNLTAAYNVRGIASDGATFSGGLDGSGAAYSANQLGTSLTVGGVPFTFGPAGASNAVANRAIALPAGAYATLSLLATGVNGNQPSRAFVVTYSDGTSATFTQSVSDWFTPQGYPGEILARTTDHRNLSGGTAQSGSFDLYAYTFALDAGRTVQSVTLPATRDVLVLAATLGTAAGGTALVQLYQHCSYGGWAASFTATGSVSAAQLVARGGVDNDASSIKVATGYKVTLYDGDNQTGTAITVGAGDTACLVASSFNDVLSSMKIEVDTGGGDVDDTVVACGNAPGGNTSGDVPYVRVHLKQGLLKVCVEQSFWNVASNATAIRRFFAYFDGIAPELQGLFSFMPSGAPFLVQITSPTGGACACVDPKLGSRVGVTVTGDAYPNGYVSDSGISVPGFWGYLLTLHEFVNVWTGEMTSGWPTDWWADHRSPFPNAMDETVMRDLGTRQGNQTLVNAATAQHERYTMSEPDAQVVMFLRFFDLFGGFPTYNRVFSLVRADGLHWDTVSGQNPSPIRTEYVIAYLQLGFRTHADLTQSDFVAAGVSRATAQDPAYTITAAAVGDIADAHCSIASAKNAGRDVSAALANLRTGKYAAARMASAQCGAACPAECGCDSTVNQCVAPWRAR